MGLFSGIKKVFSGVSNVIKKVTSPITKAVGAITKPFIKVLSPIVNPILKPIGKLLRPITKALSPVLPFVSMALPFIPGVGMVAGTALSAVVADADKITDAASKGQGLAQIAKTGTETALFAGLGSVASKGANLLSDSCKLGTTASTATNIGSNVGLSLVSGDAITQAGQNISGLKGSSPSLALSQTANNVNSGVNSIFNNTSNISSSTNPAVSSIFNSASNQSTGLVNPFSSTTKYTNPVTSGLSSSSMSI